jgi:hypothetical protein
VAVDVEAVQWETAPALGSVNKLGLFTAAGVKEPTMGLIVARMGNMTASSVIRIAPAPARIVVTPASVSLSPGATQQFTAQAYDQGNEALAMPAERVAWRAEPTQTGASVSSSGLLRTPAGWRGRITVTACVGQVCGQAEVTVAEELTVVEAFETERQWRYRSELSSAPGGVACTEDTLRPGNHCLELRYDLSQGAGTRIASAELDLPLPEGRALSLDVLGDGQGAWLRARLSDASGRVFFLDLANSLSWKGSWRRLTAPLPEEAESPVTLECIYLAEIHEGRGPAGAISVDDIAVTR